LKLKMADDKRTNGNMNTLHSPNNKDSEN